MPKATGRRIAVAAAAVALGGGLLGDAPAATPTFSSAASAATPTPASTLTVARPSGTSLGKVLVAFVAFRSASAAAISAPSGWSTLVQTACTTASSPLSQVAFLRIAGAAEPAEYTFSGPGPTGAVGSVLAYSGVDLVQPVQATSGTFTRNSKGLTGAITTTAAPTLLVGGFSGSGRSVISAPTGMTARTDALTGTAAPNARQLTADQLISASGSHSRTARAATQNTCNVIQLVALNAAPDPPASTAPPQISGTALEGQTLSASTGSWSGSPTAYSHAWERCDAGGGGCVAVPAATGATYALTSADVGSRLRVVVTASNSGGSASAASNPTDSVVPITPPTNESAPTVTGDAREGQTLTAAPGAWSGSPAAFAYQWERCDTGGGGCAAIPGAEGQVYVLAFSDAGSTVRALVTATNDAGSTMAGSAVTPVVLPLAPSATASPEITGSPQLGELLAATPGTWNGEPSSFAYQWERCDSGGAACAAVGGATAETYELGSADLGSRIRVLVTASNAGGSGSAASAPTAAILPEAPANLTAPTISGTPRASEPLTADPGSWSSSPTGYAFQWQRSDDGGMSWMDTGDGSSELVPDEAAVGFVLRVVVTASNAGGSASAPSASTAAILPAVAPESVVAPSITGTAQEGTELFATQGTWTGSPTSYAFQWEQCGDDGVTCAPIAGATSPSYTPVATDIGIRIRVAVGATNPGGTGTASSTATAAVLRAAPVSTSLPVVSGTTLEGETLSATTGEWSGDPTSFAYLWHRCAPDGEACSAVTWADSSTYRLREADAGLSIRVQITATNDGGPTSAMSEETAAVVPLPPANQAPPVVSGVLEQGEVVTASAGTWQSSAPLSYGYQWQSSSDGGTSWADIPGASDETYLLTLADVDTLVRVVVSAANAGGTASAPSDATAPISSPGRPVNTGQPTYAGFVQAGKTLTADPGQWSGDPAEYGYQWQRSDDGGQSWSDAPGSTESTYSLSVLDVGLAVRIQITATNAFGSTVAVSPSTSIHASSGIVAVANQQWRCNSTVDLSLVKATIWTRDTDAVVLGNGCTGRMGRVEVDTWTADALKTVNSSVNAAHDLVIESGVAVCHDRVPGAHQDGWQSMGGARITVRNFVWACGDLDDPYGLGVAQAVVISRAGASVTTPTDTVVEHSVLMPGAAHTFAIGESLRSGIRNSVICPDRTGLVPFTDLGGAVEPIYESMVEAPVDDPRCSSLSEAIAWAQSAP